MSYCGEVNDLSAIDNFFGEQVMSDIRWYRLIGADCKNLRFELSERDLEKGLIDQVKTINEAIEISRQILFVAGLKATDGYLIMSKENAFTKEETLINPRVRIDQRYKTPSFYWERTVRHMVPVSVAKKSTKTKNYETYVPINGSKIKRKVRVYLSSEHIPINKKNLMTSMSNFEKEPVWVRTAAQLIEPKLSKLRKLNKDLSNINKQVLLLLKNIEMMRI